MTHEIADALGPIFSIPNARVVVVPTPAPGARGLATFEGGHDAIHLDALSLAQMPESEVLHTLGEEVGHALHHQVRPELWCIAHPEKTAVVEAVKKGAEEYAVDLRRTVLTANLFEMVGFWCGLRHLRSRRGARAAREYANLWTGELAVWTVRAGRTFVDAFCGGHAESVVEHYLDDPAAYVAEVAAARPGTLPKDLRSFWDKLNHRIGYRLACDIFGLEGSRQDELIAWALKASDIEEFQAQAAIAQQEAG